MQSVSTDLANAILSQERQPLVRLFCDWQRNGYGADGSVDDLTADVVSVTTSRELATDLPAAAKLFSGQAAATATVTLAHRDPAGDPAKHGGWYYSALNAASPLAAFDRKGAPARLELGFVTVDGPEYVTVLEGSVRSLQVTSGGRVAVLQLEDRSASFRRQVTLPMVVADGESAAGAALRPSLRTTWLASWLARQCGWYPSPPPRTGCKFLATMHGSAYPEIGAPYQIDGVSGQQPGFCPTATHTDTPPFVMAVATSAVSNPVLRYNLGGAGSVSPNNGSTILIEGWWKFRSAAADQPLFLVFRGGGAGTFLSMFWQQSTGSLTLTFNRGAQDASTNRAIIGPTITPGSSVFHYYGVQVDFNSTNVSATFRYDSTTTGPTNSATTASVTTSETWDSISLDHGRVSSFVDAGNNLFVSDVQVTTESSPGTWNNAYVPTADIYASAAIDNRLLATPSTTEEAWGLLQQIAEAEFATTGFDETGRFVYWPRDRWTTAPYTTSQRTLTAATSLKELEVTEAIDQVRNKVVIRATQVEVQPSGIVWRSAQAHSIPASGNRTMWLQFDNPVANLDTSVVYQLAGGSSRYLAANQRDGSEIAVSTLTFAVTPFAQAAKVVITNPNAFVVYLVADASVPGAAGGAPYLVMEGQFVLFGQETNTGLRSEASDSASISTYDEQLLELEAVPFRQDLDAVDGLAADLIADLKDPGPVLSDVPAVGDPRIQLGDRLTIVDTEGLGFSADFHVSKIEYDFSPNEGLSMTLSLRAA